MIPPCHNRPPRAAGYAVHTRTMYKLRQPDGTVRYKPLYRWVWNRFEDRCATHDGRGIGPNGENYPEAHGWECRGCRWHPDPAQRAVDNPAHNPGVIHTEPFWGDPPGTISHGQATYKPLERMRVIDLGGGYVGLEHTGFEPGLPPGEPL